MACDDLGIVDVQAGELGAFLSHELVACSVCTVFTDSVLGVILIRKTIHICVCRDGLMECGIEGNYLRHRRKHCLNGSDSEDVRRVVERCEVAADLDFLHHVFVYEGA